MRWRPLTWLLLSVFCFAAAFYFWRMGDEWAARRAIPQHASGITDHASRITSLALPIKLLSQPGNLNSSPPAASLTNHASRVTSQFANRLSNTTTPLSQLMRNDRALLLENALLDTAQPAPAIPAHLRAQGDPGSYLVQARGQIDDAFRSMLKTAGATVVSYIPNNAYLVRASAAIAQQLQADPRTQAVLPYEPYYKLKPSLLKLAVGQQPLPDGSVLNLLLFADAREGTLAELKNLGAQVLGEDQSPFGPVVNVRPPVQSLPFLAGLPGVQEMEMALARASANDMSRVRVGVSVNTLVPTNYLGLTGTNILVNVNDSGVDATHPDLSVVAVDTNALVDPNGHGTHVAGIIASSGGKSSTVTNASGPNGPYSGTNNQFRGIAPGAKIFAQSVGMFTRPFNDGSTLTWPSDGALQEGAAQTNAFISNNSWNFVGVDSQTYDLHAASYDAAVRDALPNVPGSQPLLLVFSAGNGGGGSDDGSGGTPDSVESPGTAKNVITVGAIEQLRNITNIVTKIGDGATNTSTPWLGLTDSSDEVASFSGRGNVGIGIEGDFGRFKPDVVAPGTFVISTRSGQWDTNAYYNPTSHIIFTFQNLLVVSNGLFGNSIDIPDNAVQLNLSVVPNTNSPRPFPHLTIYVNQAFPPTNATTATTIGTNYVSLPPDGNLIPVGASWFYAVANLTTQAVYFDLVTDIVVTNDLGNYLQVLEGLNDSLGGYYRYESGTSMAAADASGMLALMQEFFESRLHTTNHSPALMKALLINGARTLADQYDFNTRAPFNSQGWGLINLPTSLPGGLTNITAPTNSIAFVEQNPTNALATGQSETRFVSISASGRNQPLRVTLVWTDPAGNPIASVKLVNDLDLVVTNLDNGDVFFGNDIISGSDFNLPWNTNNLPNIDLVNNVENVYLSPRLSTNYSVTVVGRHVNVNAVTANPNNVAQDYALVISSGDGLASNALTVASSPIVYLTQPLVTAISNQFAGSPGISGGFLFNQRVGASTPLLGTNSILLPTDANGVVTLGMTNQWHFYTLTNNTTFTNAAFVTFLPVNLAVPRMGVFEPTAELATRPEADIELYVAPPAIPNNYALTNLNSAVVAAADKSLGRGGTETIVYSNSTQGIYYIGVQSQDQQAAEYAILGVFSELPFAQANSNGDLSMIGIPAPAPIPDATVDASGITVPGAATIVCIAPQQIKLHRVIVTNNISHELMGDMIGTLKFGGNSVVLNNHSPDSAVANQTYIYDDSQERNVPGAQHTDGPGSLMDFGGKQGLGPWIFTEVDTAPSHVGTNNYLLMFLERQQDLTGNGIIATIEPGACRVDFLDVPTDATSVTVTVAVVTAPLPIDYTVTVCPANGGPCKSVLVTNALGGSVVIDQTDLPPLAGGTSYTVTTCNLGTSPITVNIRAVFGFSFNTIIPIVTAQTTVPVPIPDDGVTDIYLTNNTHGVISSLDVGLLLTDLRVSDLAITLISPNGTRVLLYENRGGLTTNGLGIGTFNLSVVTNMAPFYTNNFDAAPVGLYAPGATFEGWNVLSNLVDVLDDYTCFCLSNHVLALLDGAVSNSLPTTNALTSPALNPYILTYKVNHLPWLEGMVTWWPLDVDGSDIFGGLNGLLLGDVVFSTGATNLFFDDFNGPALNPIWRAGLPNVGTGGSPAPILTNAGAPSFAFGTLNVTNTIIKLSNNLTPLQRRGWSSVTNFIAQDFRYEVRFNTLDQGAVGGTGANIGGILEIWILNSANTNLFDMVSVYEGTNGASEALLAGSTIDDAYNTRPFNFQTNSWYRLVLNAPPNQGVRAAVLDDNGVELTGASFAHGASAFSSGFKIVLSQFGAASGAASTNTSPVDVAVDYAKLTTGQSGEVNQAFYGDGVATRMMVPRAPELNVGQGRGFSIEGWINPANVLIPAPLVQWYDPAPPTNQTPLGVQFWLALSNVPGALGAVLWDTNSLPHGITTLTNALTNGGWQHVALTYSTNTATAVLYTNGQQAAAVQFPTNFVPRTYSDLYLGYHIGKGINVGVYSVLGTANIFSAGRAAPVAPGGSGGGTLPGQIPIAANQTAFHFQSLGGIAWCDPTAPSGAEGLATNDSNISAYNGISGFVANHVFPLVGVFLTDAAPQNPSPPTLNFTTNGIGRNFLTLSPAIGQVFYIGDGSTDSGQLQTFNVPVGATRLFLGFADAIGFTGLPGAYSDNGGSLSIEVTSGDPTISYAGGLDEFSLYQRALSPCEVNAIYNAGSRGKYGTNVLVCPVATEVTLLTGNGYQTYVFTNGVTWTNNGPQWETNTISFLTATNPTAIVVRGLNPYNPADPTNAPNNLNAIVDDFVLSELVTNTINGLLHFTEDTNLAVLPIKFAPTPYANSNFPPVLIFSNSFISAAPGLYNAVRSTIPGSPNSPGIGTRNWTVTQGSVTVVSNAFLDVVATNWVAMATGTVQCLLPTTPGSRYQLSYNLRGPCAVGWWNGSVDPLSQRAQDLISGNNGAFFFGATNVQPGFVGNQMFRFDGPFTGQYDDPDIFPDKDIDDPANKIELADPPQLQFTNAFTLEGWINPSPPPTPGTGSEYICPDQQIFFRGYPKPFDCSGQGDPYWLALEPTPDLTRYDLHFHIADAQVGTLGADVLTTNGPIVPSGGSNGGWWHIAAVFDKPFTNIVVVNGTNTVTITTNAMRLYVNGVCVVSNYTTISPYQDMDPALSPGVAIGGRCGYDWTQPYQGFLDEITAYARALTDPEIAAIATNGPAGKADLSVAPAQSLAKLTVAVDGSQLDTVYGDNSQWTTHSVTFTALETNAVVTLQSLLPGTLVDGLTLTEVAPELYYLPEVPLSDLYGGDTFGVWTLEVWDNRTGPAVTNNAQLQEWQLNFALAPSNPPPVISLSHGIPYTYSLPTHSIQYFVVPVPQWATLATNILLFSEQVHTTIPTPISVLFNPTNYPSIADPVLIGPLVTSGTTVLSTNGTPPLTNGQPYYLAITNPYPYAVTYALEVSFDITTLANCQVATNFVGPAGIPRYFQFDVPTNGEPASIPAQAVSLWLSGAQSNLTLVMSEHLPLPDLNHYDYISQQPGTNNQIVMLVTNSTPFPIQTNRWYVGIFNTTATNVAFDIEACLSTDYPIIIPLTNGVPFVVRSVTSAFAAPPGPPQRIFFNFVVPNAVPGILFELYNMSGDADLVLQQAVPPTMAPYFDGSFFTGTTPEQIVVRTNAQMPDLRGEWYLGVYNNALSNVAYTIRATLPNANNLLVSAQPIRLSYTPLNPPQGLLLSWNSVAGERYFVQYTPSLVAPATWTNIGIVTASTPLTTFEVLPAPSGAAFYRIVQVSSFLPTLYIQLWPTNQVRLYWATAYPGYTLQSKLGLFGTWITAGLPVTVVGNQYVAFDTIGPGPKYYRLFK
jgi:subtilisin-like proprotein convertase family protein